MQRVEGAAAQPEGGFARAGELLGYPTRVDPWAAYTDECRGVAEYRVLAEVLTPQAAAAQQLASIGYEEVISYGDEPLEREPDDDGGWYEQGSFLANLPPVCDRQHQPWRLAMVRALDDLTEDLRSGRAPPAALLPRKDGVLPCLVLQARPEEQFYRAECQSANARRGRCVSVPAPSGHRFTVSVWLRGGDALRPFPRVV